MDRQRPSEPCPPNWRNHRKEFSMNQFLSNLVAALRRRGGARPAPRRQRRACLRVETMEQRTVPSTAAPPVGHVAVAPALTAPLPAQTGGGDGVSIDPLGSVHGYKWRRGPWFPHDTTPADTLRLK